MTEWIDAALMIVVVASWTPGLQWELSTLIERGHAAKLIVLIPPSEHRETRWKRVCARFVGTPWHAAMLLVDPRWAIAVAPCGNGIVVICSETQDSGDYEAAIDVAAYGTFVLSNRSEFAVS